MIERIDDNVTPSAFLKFHPPPPARATEKEWEEMNEGVQKGMKEGWVRPVVQKTYEIADAFQAHQDVIVNSGSKGKLVVRCQ